MRRSLLDSDEEPIPAAEKPGSLFISLVPPPEPADNSDDGAAVVNNEVKSNDSEPTLSMAESVRQSGLAYSAAVAFFASVVFLLIIGWGADLLFGSSPWGIVIGIVLGSIIGFVQFFRINSQIFGKTRETTSGRFIISDDDEASQEKPPE